MVARSSLCSDCVCRNSSKDSAISSVTDVKRSSKAESLEAVSDSLETEPSSISLLRFRGTLPDWGEGWWLGASDCCKCLLACMEAAKETELMDLPFFDLKVETESVSLRRGGTTPVISTSGTTTSIFSLEEVRLTDGRTAVGSSEQLRFVNVDIVSHS